ncbi:MAG: FtsX-like permease family protein [Marinilabiliaceae bacterium]|nr:FtsX-like permease family protein [Marinilabiliaceae bacterium]
MRTGLFISRRLIKEQKAGNTFSRPVNVIVITGIALGLAIMILAIAILTGFKQSIRDKIAGFAGHIQVTNFDSNYSYETVPVSGRQEFIDKINASGKIRNIQVYATKAGIIKTDENIQGVVLKGVGPDYDWSFFESNLVEGSVPELSDSVRSTAVLISRKISELLNLEVEDDFAMYFVQDPPRMRRFTVSGIYDTSLEEMDKIFVICDIRQIRRLNSWEDMQVSGFEILLKRFKDIDLMTFAVRDAIGYKFEQNQDQLKVSNIRIKYPQLFDWLGFQDTNVIIIIILMLVVAGFNMISGLLILILEKTNLIGILKALGSSDILIRRIFLYQATYLILNGLLWGNLIGLGLGFMQLKFEFISLDPSSYYLTKVPVNIDLWHVALLNAGTIFVILIVLILPSRLISRISPIRAIKFD